MASLLPVAEAPILRMSGGGMESLLPAAPPVHIAGMHGGGSLLPHAPDVPIPGMHGGVHLYSIPHGRVYPAISASSFGVTKTFTADKDVPENPSCAPITDTATPVCEILQPFVDRRVQALLTRVRFPSGNADIDMGCGRIVRKGQELTISFHEKAITLLSCDLTGTFAKCHEGMRRHTPSSVKNSGVKGTHVLLSWMLGSPVNEEGTFDLITFMDQMKGGSSMLPLKGFRQFLSYHKEKSENEEMDVLRYAMELYGYRTGTIENTKDLYGLILSPTTAVRRVDKAFAVYDNGTVTPGEWDPAWNSSAGFAVFEPATAPVASASAKAASANAAKAAASAKAASASAKAASAKKADAPSHDKKEQEALNAVFAAHLQAQYNALVTTKSGEKFSGIKNETTVIVNDYHLIDPYDHDNGVPYYLRGVIHHSGDDKGGHYVYYYRTPGQENDWIRFSDKNVGQPKERTIDPNVDELNKGYIYLFERGGGSDGINKGIENHGNSCWMNAALQMFYHIEEYRTYVESFNESFSLPPHIKEMTRALQQIFQRYSTAKSQSIECPNEYNTLFQAAFKGKEERSQQDAMEFITKVLLGIISPPENGIFLENDPRAPIYNLFKLDFRSKLMCTTPVEAFSTTPGQMPMLILPVPEREVTLDTLLHQYSAIYEVDNNTKVNGMSCNDPKKQIDFDIHPDNKYVILQLSRFT